MAIYLFLQKISRKRWEVPSKNLLRAWIPMLDEHTITFHHLHERTYCAGCMYPLCCISVGISCIVLVQLVMNNMAVTSQNQACNMVQSFPWCCKNSSWWIVALPSIDLDIFKFDHAVNACYGVRILYQWGKEGGLKTTIWNR